MKKITRQEARTYLNKYIVPIFRERGFKGSLPHLHRISEDMVDLLTFQFDRRGGGFVIELGQIPNKPYTLFSGEKISPTKVNPWYLNIKKRKRIHPYCNFLSNIQSDNGQWFRYDRRPWFGGDPLEKIEKNIKKNIPYIEKYFNKQKNR